MKINTDKNIGQDTGKSNVSDTSFPKGLKIVLKVFEHLNLFSGGRIINFLLAVEYSK